MSAANELRPKAKLNTVKAACCPGCGEMEPENEEGFQPPISLFLMSCGHYGCVKCGRACMDSECAYDMCPKCAGACEGCSEVHCPEHTIAECYCATCAPAEVLHEHNRPAYCFED